MRPTVSLRRSLALALAAIGVCAAANAQQIETRHASPRQARAPQRSEPSHLDGHLDSHLDSHLGRQLDSHLDSQLDRVLIDLERARALAIGTRDGAMVASVARGERDGAAGASDREPAPGHAGATAHAALPWQLVDARGPTPLARHGAALAYDACSDRLIVSGGQVGGEPTAQVWVLANGFGGAVQAHWIPLDVLGDEPTPRADHSAVYDAVRDRLVVFGGVGPGGEALGDAFVLHHASGRGGRARWQRIAARGAGPGARAGHTAVLDAGGDRMIVLAGEDPRNDVHYRDAWVLHGASGNGDARHWQELAPAGEVPAPRRGASALFDPATDRVLLFGGDVDAPASAVDEVRVLHHASGVGGIPLWSALRQCPPRGDSIAEWRSGVADLARTARLSRAAFDGAWTNAPLGRATAPSIELAAGAGAPR